MTNVLAKVDFVLPAVAPLAMRALAAIAIGAGFSGSIQPTSAHAASEATLYPFAGAPSDGATPRSGLINVGGNLFGTTTSGGTLDVGTVYQLIPPNGGNGAWTDNVLHSFSGGEDDGSGPLAGLINVNGTFYGTTQAGGDGTDGACDPIGCGTVFKIKPGKSTSIIYKFKGGNVNGFTGNDGAYPHGGLVRVGNTFYGTTYLGGTGNCNCGTVFTLTPKGAESVIYSFNGGNDGAYPNGGLVYLNGLLYGTTRSGGSASCPTGVQGYCGTIFSVALNGDEAVLHAFQGTNDGADPMGGMLAVRGLLYGTAQSGGQNGCNFGGEAGCGTVFSVAPNGTFSVVHFFQGEDGAIPRADLISVNGFLYGTTSGGGAYGLNEPCCGTVFQITRKGVESVLYSFEELGDGGDPESTLLNIGGTLLGTATGGPNNNRCGCGLVFEVTP